MSNLLPTEEKQNRLNEYGRRRAGVVLISLGFLFIVSTLMLSPSFFSLRSKLTAVTEAFEEAEANTREKLSRESLDSVASVKRQLGVLSVESEERLVGERLEQTLNARNKGVLVRGIHVADGGLVEVRGSASSREALTEFIESLRGNSLIERVESPIGNLLAEEGAQFTIKIYFR